MLPHTQNEMRTVKDNIIMEDTEGPKEKKFKALFEARTVLSMIGTMDERMRSKRLLKVMQQKGLNSV